MLFGNLAISIGLGFKLLIAVHRSDKVRIVIIKSANDSSLPVANDRNKLPVELLIDLGL